MYLSFAAWRNIIRRCVLATFYIMHRKVVELCIRLERYEGHLMSLFCRLTAIVKGGGGGGGAAQLENQYNLNISCNSPARRCRCAYV